MPALLLHGRVKQANQVQTSGMRVLVRCFGPEESLISRLLTGARGPFVAATAQTLHMIENETITGVHAAESKYRAPFAIAGTGAG